MVCTSIALISKHGLGLYGEVFVCLDVFEGREMLNEHLEHKERYIWASMRLNDRDVDLNLPPLQSNRN